jgi:hypothetical protein
MKKHTIILCFILTVVFICSNIKAKENTCVNSPLRKGECFLIEGNLLTYNGWPPALRIEDKSSKRIFGVGPVDNEIAPDYVLKVLPTKIEGTFYLCPFNETTSVPYDKREIEMVCIQSVTNGNYWYWNSKTGIFEKRELTSNNTLKNSSKTE